MAKNQESINRSLFELLRSRGYAPTLLDTSGKEIPVPEEAEVFQFKFTKDGEEYGTVTASIDGLHKLVIYFGDDVANSEKEDNGGDDSWYKLLNHLKRFAQKHQLSFEVKNRDHLKYDMAKREHMKKQERISEGYHPMGKKASYNDNIPTVKIVIEHSRTIEEGEQRYRNVNRIFLENTQGERILAPTTKPGVAQIYARHLAEGGMPHDDRWNHIVGLCEEYNKMGAFVRATRNNQFNESAQQLVNEGINHYQSLRESLSKMRGSRGYNSYFESYTPPLMEDETEENNLNELFVQETLDPRIESVMPILSKLHKKVAEMKEVNELSEWADSLTEEDLDEGDGGQQALNPAGIPEEDLDEDIVDTVKKVAGKVFDKLGGGTEEDLIKDLQKSAGVPQTGKKPEPKDKPVDEARMFGYDINRVPSLKISYDDSQELKKLIQQLEQLVFKGEMEQSARKQVASIRAQLFNILQRNGLKESDLMGKEEALDPAHQADQKINTPAVQRKQQGGDWKVTTQDLAKADEKNMTSAAGMSALKKRMSTIEEDEVEESALQASFGIKKYGKKGMDKLRDAGQKHASEKTMQNIRAEFSDKEEPITEVGDTPAGLAAVQKVGQRANRALGDAGTGYSGSEVDNLDKTYAARDRANSILNRERIKANDKNPTKVVGGPNHGNRMEEVTEDGEFAGDYATGEAGQWRNKGPKANKPATIGDLVGEGEEKDTLDPWKHVNPRVDNPKIKGTDKRAKSAYYPTPKPPVKKLDTPLTNETVAEGSEDLARILNIAGINK